MPIGPRRRSRRRHGSGQARIERPRLVAVATGARGLSAASRRRSGSTASAAMSVLVSTRRSASSTWRGASGARSRSCAVVCSVDHRHHGLDGELGSERPVRCEGLQDRARIGEPAGLDHDALEIRHHAARAICQQPRQRGLQVRARGAAQAASCPGAPSLGARAAARRRCRGRPRTLLTTTAVPRPSGVPGSGAPAWSCLRPESR